MLDGRWEVEGEVCWVGGGRWRVKCVGGGGGGEVCWMVEVEGEVCCVGGGGGG